MIRYVGPERENIIPVSWSGAMNHHVRVPGEAVKHVYFGGFGIVIANHFGIVTVMWSVGGNIRELFGQGHGG